MIVIVAPTGAPRPPVLTTRESALGRIALSAARALAGGGAGSGLFARDTDRFDTASEWVGVDAVEIPSPGLHREWVVRRASAPMWQSPTVPVGSYDARGRIHGPSVELYTAEFAGDVPAEMLVTWEVWDATVGAAHATALAVAPGSDPGEWTFTSVRGAFACRVDAQHPAAGVMLDARAVRAKGLLAWGDWPARAGAISLEDIDALLCARISAVAARHDPHRALRIAEAVDALAWVRRIPTPPHCLAAVTAREASIAPDAAREIESEARSCGASCWGVERTAP